MQISEHPDFKETENVTYCRDCQQETVHVRGLRLMGSEYDSGYVPPEYNECTVCGRDDELPEDDE